MRCGQKRILVGLAGLILGTVSVAVYLFLRPIPVKAIIIPTLAVLPSVTPSATVTLTLTPSSTPTFTATFTPSATETPLPSPTLATRVLVITAVMPGVQALTRDMSTPAYVAVAPPEPFEPLPDATQSAPPFWGWYRFESDHPAVAYGGAAWLPVLAADASRGQYHRTDDVGGYARFPFVGAGLRVRYVAARNMGEFALIVDGQVLDNFDAYAPARIFPITSLYTLTPGSHLLQIQPTGHKNSLSEGFGVGLDAIQVYRDNQVQIVPAAEATNLPTVTPQIARVALIAAPPTVQATPSPIPPSEQTVTLVIAYDENGNHAVDPAEGVRDISARVLDAETNRVLSSGFTDASGFVRLQVITDAPARLVVPYFGETWELPVGRGSRDSSFTLLLAPGNQPGLIP